MKILVCTRFPGCEVSVSSLGAHATELATLRRERLTGGCAVERWEEMATVTRDGWPAWVCQATVVDGGVRAERIGAFYRFLDLGGHVVVSASALTPTRRDEIIDSLLEARPDWSGRVVGIDDLFDRITS
jgi:hypothetical protein